MPQRVLLVDDETDYLEAMAFRMTARGMNVVTASSAQEAIEQVEKERFDAIVLDYQLPGIDGLNLLKQIRASRPDSRVILLTGYATPQKRTEAMDMGAVELFEKPLDLRILSKKLSELKEKDKSRQQNKI